MSQVCIDAKVLGSSRHLVLDGGFQWSDSVPRGSWHLSGEQKTSPSARCLDTLLRLSNVELPSLPPKYVKAMSTVLSGSQRPVMWQHAVPHGVYQEYFKNLVQETSSAFSGLSFGYYDAAWVAGSRLLASLKPAKIDAARWSQLSTDSGQNSQLIEGFKPGRTGYAKQVVYNRFGTRTGRLTVEDGPNILTLKKENRDMLKSAYEDGVICSLDFRALEVRVVLAEAGKSSSADDLYEEIARVLFGGSVSRDVVKTAVIAELYGISRGALIARLQAQEEKVDRFIKLIGEHFRLSDLRSRLKDQLKTSGRLTNRFGRPLFLDEGNDNLLINTYAQSSGVDVAMLGFDSVVQALGTDGVRPLFVLHDAIILDVRGDRLVDVEGTKSVNIPGYDFSFPLKCEKLV